MTCAILLAVSSCSGDGDDEGELEFRGEQEFLPALNLDTGWVPEASPASVRVLITAGGGVEVVARASTDGSSMSPIAGSGDLSVSGALNLEVSARIDTSGFEYEGVVESFAYAIPEQRSGFEPWTLDAGVSVSNALSAQELGSVPIPSVPGASLTFAVTGGNLSTSFQGTCAETGDGFGQYQGEITTIGTIEASASIVLDIPVVGEETFGPFEFSVPVPETTNSVDLGTLSLASGEQAADRGLCDGGGGKTSGDGDGDGDGDTTGDGDGDTTGDGDGDTTGDGDGDGDGDTTGDGDGDAGCVTDADCGANETCAAGECIPA